MISDYEKHLYNIHLKTMRQKSNKPFNFRKNFNDIDDKTLLCLKKLSNFFNKHKNINPADFFSAPFKVYKDETFFDLCFFNSLKAIKAYTISCKNLSDLDPDAEEQLAATKQSLLFIYNFCKENKININQYLTHKTNNIYTFLLHLKDRNVNLFSLLSFDNLNNCLSKSDSQVIKFMFEDNFLDKINHKKIKFLNSNKCKFLVINGLEKLKNNLKNELNTSN